MPKVLTVRRREGEGERARLYLKSRLMLPTIPLGMVGLIAGYGGIVLMWMQDELTPAALYGSAMLFLAGAVWGWAHARYEQYLVAVCPEYLARKFKQLEAAKAYRRIKREVANAGPIHKGRRFVGLFYVVGICAQLAVTAYFIDTVGIYAAVFLPWAGYFNAKVLFWRKLFVS